MIERQYGRYYGICDVCNEVADPCTTWDEAKDTMKQEGWQFKFSNGEWQHVCPTCRKMGDNQ